ncbi:hypothetical protein ES702_04169 [subsurface metagenome]
MILRLGSNVILVDYKNFVSKSDKLIHIIFHDINFKNGLVKSFINIPVFQIIAYAKTISKGRVASLKKYSKLF